MSASRWKDFVVHRKESLTTTWRFRLAVIACCGLVVWGTRGVWVPQVGRSLVCAEQIGPSDLILVDNSDQNYLSFERAAALRKAGVASRVLVPVQADIRNPAAPNMVSEGIVGVMTRVAWLQDFEMLPLTEVEPITLNAAYQIRDYVKKHHIRSMTITVSAFRSQRTMLIYDAVMRQAGVTVRCVPILGEPTVVNWAQSWHGIQGVSEQFLKLQYYRFYVLPFVARGSGQGA
jgi:hypothetical protein